MRPFAWNFFCLLLLSFPNFSQIISNDLKKVIEAARLEKQPIKIAEQFLGLPYKAFALSKENPEQLITDLSGFDCVTLFDNVYSLYTSKGKDSSFINQLIKVRYFHPGRITYENRNHYFSSTAQKLMAEGLMIPITDEKYESYCTKKLNVLSKMLSKHHYQVSIDSVVQMENKFSSNKMPYFPTKNIPKILNHLNEGDVVLFLTNQSTMDFHHVGFLVKKGKDWHVLHASQLYKKVIVSPETLIEYMHKHPSFPGIQVYHLNLP